MVTQNPLVPTATALVQQDAQRSERLARLEPASNDELRDELEACLALVAPVGMNEDARAEWFAVAGATIGHLPTDLLRAGCMKAREVCDHHSKIVPVIVAETKEWLQWRKDAVPSSRPAPSPLPPERRIDSPMTPADTEEMNAIMARIGASTRYHPDGRRYETDVAAEKATARGPLRKPTRQDYIEMGCDPAVLDSIGADL